jgi:hypothetical protein
MCLQTTSLGPVFSLKNLEPEDHTDFNWDGVLKKPGKNLMPLKLTGYV